MGSKTKHPSDENVKMIADYKSTQKSVQVLEKINLPPGSQPFAAAVSPPPIPEMTPMRHEESPSPPPDQRLMEDEFGFYESRHLCQ